MTIESPINETWSAIEIRGGMYKIYFLPEHTQSCRVEWPKGDYDALRSAFARLEEFRREMQLEGYVFLDFKERPADGEKFMCATERWVKKDSCTVQPA